MIDFLHDYSIELLIGFGAILLAAAVAIGYMGYVDHRDNVAVKQVTITGKEIVYKPNYFASGSSKEAFIVPGYSIYLIFTPKEVFTTESLNVYGCLLEGEIYTVKISGSTRRVIEEIL